MNIVKTNELSTLLNELSISYMEVYSSRQSLNDLTVSMNELRTLLDGLEAEIHES